MLFPGVLARDLLVDFRGRRLSCFGSWLWQRVGGGARMERKTAAGRFDKSQGRAGLELDFVWLVKYAQTFNELSGSRASWHNGIVFFQLELLQLSNRRGGR